MWMPVPTEFLRGVLGVFAIGCAYLAGRSLIAFRRGWQKKISTFYGWMIRMIVCLAGIAFRNPVDTVDIIVWALTAILFGLGIWTASHQKPPEDLTDEIFKE